MRRQQARLTLLRWVRYSAIRLINDYCNIAQGSIEALDDPAGVAFRSTAAAATLCRHYTTFCIMTAATRARHHQVSTVQASGPPLRGC